MNIEIRSTLPCITYTFSLTPIFQKKRQVWQGSIPLDLGPGIAATRCLLQLSPGGSDAVCVCFFLDVSAKQCLFHVYHMSVAWLLHGCCMSIACLLHVYCICIAFVLHLYCMFIACLSHVCCMSIAFLLHVYCISIAFLLHVYCTFIACLP